MNDELITRLRDFSSAHGIRGTNATSELFAEAADALEAAQAEAAQAALNIAFIKGDLAFARADNGTLRAERDAEAALADQLAEALHNRLHGPYLNSDAAALAAHRERRTTPTKDGER